MKTIIETIDATIIALVCIFFAVALVILAGILNTYKYIQEEILLRK